MEPHHTDCESNSILCTIYHLQQQLIQLTAQARHLNEVSFFLVRFVYVQAIGIFSLQHPHSYVAVNWLNSLIILQHRDATRRDALYFVFHLQL